MIIWLASYPKSGNTWVRSLISSLLYTNDGLFKIESLNKIGQFPDTTYFKTFTNNFGDIHEIKKYWIPAQDKLNADGKIKFFKTHNINCKIDDYSFTNKKNTLATIYIIRDPRNLVSSISNHFSKSIDDSKDFLFTPRFIGGSKLKGGLKKNDLLTLLGTWSEHYKFWKRNNQNYLLIKYEDLVSDTGNELNRIIFFLKKFIPISSDKTKNNNIVKSTTFEKLKDFEKQGNFKENAFNKSLEKKVNFFHLGPKNKWENILEDKIKRQIEDRLSDEMKELGYL